MAYVDPATIQTAAGIPDVKSMKSSYRFSARERDCLQTLAKRVAEIAALPVQKERRRLWTAHNDLQSDHPMVFIDPENGWNECIPAHRLVCEDPLARVWEMYLLKQIYWFEEFRDDKVIENTFDVPYVYSDTGWGLELKKEGGAHGGAYKVEQALADYEKDFEKIHYPEIVPDREASARIMELAQEIFEDILTVRRKTTWWWTLGMTWDYINMRGLQDFMCDFILEPEWVHKTMNLLCNGVLKRLDWLEKNGMLPLNTGATYVGSGGFGFTATLPKYKDHVTTRDMWGFVESQETTAISPEHYGEFIFPYHKKIAERFGLMCYGCCEPFEPRWKYVRQLPRLRRVSCSPWSNPDTYEELLGKEYIASIKPSPTPLAMPEMDEETVRRDIKNILKNTRNCIPEIIMKDNNTLGGNPRNASRWVEIVREEIERL